MTTAWGIIRYAAGSGDEPQNDCAAFDGWYYDHHQKNPDTPPADALAVYRWWCEKYPHWIVALVSANPDNMRFSNSAWESIIDRAILPDGTLCPLKRQKHQ